MIDLTKLEELAAQVWPDVPSGSFAALPCGSQVDGTIPAVRIGRRVLIPRRPLLAALGIETPPRHQRGGRISVSRRKKAQPRPRREKGTGSITSYQIGTGTRWRYEIDVPLDSGQPQIGARRHSRAGFASYEEANDELTVRRAELIRKVPQVVGRDTFGAYGQRWLDGHSCGNGTRLYIQRVLDAMQPYIGTVRLSDIRATDLAAACRGLERGTKQTPSPMRPRRGLATSTVARYANWVNTIFLAALDEGLIIKNPANSKHAGRPKGESAKRVKPFTIWNVEQLTGFCDWAIAEDEPWARLGTAVPNGTALGGTAGPSVGRSCAALLQDWGRELPAALAGSAGNVTP